MNDKKNIKNISILFVIVIMSFMVIYLFFQVIEYAKYTREAYKSVPYCYKQGNSEYLVNDNVFNYGEDGCYEKMYHLLLPELLIYKAKRNNKPLDDIYKISYMFAIPNQILKESDAVMSYGVGHFIGFDVAVSEKYKIPVYLFDCGVSEKRAEEINTKNKNIHMQNECLGTDKFLMYSQQSSSKIHTFGQKLKELNLEDKKIFLKLGIPEIHEYIDDILKYKDNITGITIGVDFWSPKHISDLNNSLKMLNSDFVLISRNSEENAKKSVYPKIKYLQVENPLCISLLYVNKKYIDSYYLPYNQNNYKIGRAEIASDEVKEYKKMTINPVVVLFEKMRTAKSYLIMRKL